MEASYHINRTILNILQHCILDRVIVMPGLEYEYILHVRTHVRMTEQHMLGLKIVFISVSNHTEWYNYPLLLMRYANSVMCGCSEVTASCSLWENLTPSKEKAPQFLQSM